MNTYKKFYPNVFVAKCTEQHQTGDVIVLTTKYGKENESIVYNFIGTSDDHFLYSIIRADGFNIQERAKRKAERLEGWAASADRKSNAYYEASKEGKDFLSLAEPIKIGHHSEKRHRALIERNWNRMGKCVEMSDKAASHQSKADYWASKADEINLSMPESLEYFEYEFEKAKDYHTKMKSGEIERSHSYSLTYAKKAVNENKKKFELAQKLWGEIKKVQTPEIISQMLESGELIQDENENNVFSVKDVDIPKIYFMEQTGTVHHRFLKGMENESQYALFRDAFNKINQAVKS